MNIRNLAFLLVAVFAASATGLHGQLRVFNIREFGASGKKGENAQRFIQRAMDSCSATGGGIVYLPPGEYSSGTIHLKSHTRLFLEAGATLFSIKDKASFDKDALLFGEDIENIAIEGRGVIDGEGAYEWRLNDIQDDFIRPNQERMEALGKPLMRSFPKKDQFGKLILLLRCKDVRISDLSLVRSPSWTIHPYGCERLTIDGVYIRSSLAEGVWADGIDPDGCKDVRIANCTIETGDDAIVFYSMNWFGPALPCENITITNCRLSSASSAIKFCDGNMNTVRKVTIDNCVITNSNRGIAFMVFDGGIVSDVTISNVTIECRRHDWFWWGDGDPFHFNIKRRSEVHKHVKFENEPPAGTIRNVLIQNVVAHGMGSSVINGHPNSWLDGITFDNVKLYLSSDSTAAYDKSIHAFEFHLAKNLRLRNVEVFWEKPELNQWGSAMSFEDIRDLQVENFAGRQAKAGSDIAAIQFNRVESATVRSSSALQGTGTFLNVMGKESRDIVLTGNDLRRAKSPFALGPGVAKDAVQAIWNLEVKR
jgi:polygalacturonase